MSSPPSSLGRHWFHEHSPVIPNPSHPAYGRDHHELIKRPIAEKRMAMRDTYFPRVIFKKKSLIVSQSPKLDTAQQTIRMTKPGIEHGRCPLDIAQHVAIAGATAESPRRSSIRQPSPHYCRHTDWSITRPRAGLSSSFGGAAGCNASGRDVFIVVAPWRTRNARSLRWTTAGNTGELGDFPGCYELFTAYASPRSGVN